MPPRPRQPRGGRRAQAATARRRVRTTSNANPPNRYIHNYRRVRHHGRRVGRLHRQMRRMTLAGFLWALITLVLAIVAVAGQSLATGAAAGGSLAVTAGVERYKRRKGRSSVPAPPRKQPTSRGSGGSRSSPGTSGTPRRRPTAKPSTQPAQPLNLNGSGGTRPRVCSDACQRSTRPKDTCKCTAPDCKHGQAVVVVKKP